MKRVIGMLTTASPKALIVDYVFFCGLISSHGNYAGKLYSHFFIFVDGSLASPN
jgi:hypothetical protein